MPYIDPLSAYQNTASAARGFWDMVSQPVNNFMANFSQNVGAPPQASDFITGPMYAARHPLDSASLLGHSMLQAQQGQYQRYLRDKQAGNYGAAAVNYLYAGIPLVGPALGAAGDQFRAHQFAAGLGGTLGVAAGLGDEALMANSVRVPRPGVGFWDARNFHPEEQPAVNPVTGQPWEPAHITTAPGEAGPARPAPLMNPSVTEPGFYGNAAALGPKPKPANPPGLWAPYISPATGEVVWPENYTNAASTLDHSNAGGANYTAEDLAAFKAKWGIADAASPDTAANAVPAGQTGRGLAGWGNVRRNPSGDTQLGATRPDVLLAPFDIMMNPAKRAFRSIVPSGLADNLTPGWEAILRDPKSQQTMMNTYRTLAPVSEQMALAQLGQGHGVNWYPMSRELPYALQDVNSLPPGISPDTFLNMKASLSPRNPVARNLAEHLEVMNNVNALHQGSDTSMLQSPDAFGQWLLTAHPESSEDQFHLPFGGRIDVADTKVGNLTNSMFGQPLSGMKVFSFGGDLTRPGGYGTMDTISGKGLGMGANTGKVFNNAPYLAARARMNETASAMGADISDIQASQWSTTKIINDRKALQTAAPKDVLNYIHQNLGNIPHTDFSTIALDALEGRYNDPAYSSMRSDYGRVDRAIRNLLGNNEGRINDFKAALRERLNPLVEQRDSLPLGEADSRSAGRAIGRVQRSIIDAGIAAKAKKK